jgi:Uma2 family endonuclease
MDLTASEPVMGYALAKPRMSAEEFLAWDAGQTLKHEFLQGEVYLMAGGEDRNMTVAINLIVALKPHLRGTPCRVYGSDVKLRVEEADAFFYPDVMVTCSGADLSDRLIKREPVLVAEVLSPSTAGYDRGRKFAAYRGLPSLVEYLLVDVDQQRCDLFRRNAEGLWVLHPCEPGQTLSLASVNLEIEAAELWADLEPAGDEAAAANG